MRFCFSLAPFLMVVSMTGYGRGEATTRGIAVSVELRAVNSRFLEVSTRLPRSLSLRENEIKDLVRRKISRGKITLLASVERDNGEAVSLKINAAAAKSVYTLLAELKKAVKSREPIKLEHLLRFSEVIEQPETGEVDEKEWTLVQQALDGALVDLRRMQQQEGGELEKDFRKRVTALGTAIDAIEKLSKDQVPAERLRLKERITQLLEGTAVDEGRLEMELALLADRLDVTEECVRFRSHDKFFLEALAANDPAGRRLNFLLQEMHREANTIGSKSTSTEIAHLVVNIKEELEKIREQLQNIE